MRQPYFALILLITSLRKAGKRRGGEAQDRCLGLGDARTFSAAQIKSKPAVSSLSAFPASWVPATERHGEHVGRHVTHVDSVYTGRGSFFRTGVPSLHTMLAIWQRNFPDRR